MGGAARRAAVRAAEGKRLRVCAARRAPRCAGPLPSKPLAQTNNSGAHEQTHQQQQSALTARIGELEAEADYSGAKAAHEAGVSALNDAIRADQAAIAAAADAARDAGERRQGAQRRARELAAAKAEAKRRGAEEEPRKVHQISLYAHITGLAFALDNLDAPVQRATVSDARGSAELRTVSVDASGRAPFETANEIWAML